EEGGIRAAEVAGVQTCALPILLAGPVSLTGTLGGSASVTITTSLSWTTGTMTGTGHTVIPSGVTLTLATGTMNLGRVLDSSGTKIGRASCRGRCGRTARGV